MDWTDVSAPPAVALAAQAQLLREAVGRAPTAPVHRALAMALLSLREHAESAQHFEQAARLAPAEACAAELARCYRAMRRFEAALDACDRFPRPGHGRWHDERGRSLLRLGRPEEGRRELRRALDCDDAPVTTVEPLGHSLAQAGDGWALLDMLDRLPGRHREATAARAYRAVALGMVGRRDEALAMVDPQRAVLRERFDPPAEFGGLERFNESLVEAILADPPPVEMQPGVAINYASRLAELPQIQALRSFIRGAMERYLAQITRFDPAGTLPPPPARATIHTATVVLREDGHNGEHIHADSYLSAVYHVAVPGAVTGSIEGRGALLVGACERTMGRAPPWPVRAIAPEPGWLTLMPSHIFHDVAPTGDRAPRISVVVDLKPAGV